LPKISYIYVAQLISTGGILFATEKLNKIVTLLKDRGYPSGALLLWRVRTDKQICTLLDVEKVMGSEETANGLPLD
jgi:hypothetical protein